MKKLSTDECPALSPDRYSYNSLLSACARAAKPAEAAMTFEEMGAMCIKRDVYSWSSLILAHVNARDVTSAHRVLCQMTGHGVRLDAACYGYMTVTIRADGYMSDDGTRGASGCGVLRLHDGYNTC